MTPLRKASLRQSLMWTYTVTCKPCGERFTWKGRSPDGVNYRCRRCGRPMTVEHTKIRTREEADLILAHRKEFNESCPSCDMKIGHHVVYHEDVDAYFLHCWNCDEEMREIEPEELK